MKTYEVRHLIDNINVVVVETRLEINMEHFQNIDAVDIREQSLSIRGRERS